MVNLVSSYAKLLAIVLVVLALQPNSADIFVNDVGIMLPKVNQRVLTAGKTFFIRCIFLRPSVEHENSIQWILPVVVYQRRGYEMKDQNETHVSSAITLTDAMPRETGSYTCFWKVYPEVEFKQYIYIYSDHEPVFFDSRVHRLVFRLGQVGRIPCKATHPNVTISLQRTHFTNNSKEISVGNNLLTIPNSQWIREPSVGILKKITLDDFGSYRCLASNSSRGIHFRIAVSGIEVMRVGSPNDVVKGDDITLICQAYLFPSQPKWTYFNNQTRQMELVIVNVTDPQDQTGMHIETESESPTGEKLLLFTSRLFINNVSMNSPTTFGCSTTDNEEEESRTYEKQLSFKVTEASKPIIIGKKSATDNQITLIKGQSINLNCTGYGSPQPEIQWFQNDTLLLEKPYMLGDSTVFILDGYPEEVGTYTCRTNNSFGEDFKHFSVDYSEEQDDNTWKDHLTIAIIVTIVLLLLAGINITFYLRKERKKEVHEGEIFPMAADLLKGKPSRNRRTLPVDEQVETVPYDKRWEFPKNRLKMGIQLGVGCFGRVVKAEAVGIKGTDETTKTVAVKMVRSPTNVAALEALVSELKILIFLGSHLNIVNLLGACTKDITKGEIFVIVEYCRYGSLQKFLINHRNNYVNQVDQFGNLMSMYNETDFRSSFSMRNDYYVRYEERGNVEWIPEIIDEEFERSRSRRNAYSTKENPQNIGSHSFYRRTSEIITSMNTRDLMCWSLQIARGMDYMASKNVFHGDLAARNILLADDGVVKVADFGMAHKMYYEANYQKSGGGLMPVKWMAIESLTDCIFSSQSDVWSYGVLLWELFTLGKVPYPGMDSQHVIVKELVNGYRMDKPDYAPNLMGEIMSSCWKVNPKKRPLFSQIEAIIGGHLESTISSYYLDLNIPYETLNDEKLKASSNDSFGLSKLLDTKEKVVKSQSLVVGSGILQKIGLPFRSLKRDPSLSKPRNVRPKKSSIPFGNTYV